MTEKISHSLDGVSETLLMTLYARARESQQPGTTFRDDRAVEMVNKLACDFSRLKMHRHDEIAVIMRMRKFDEYTRNFLTRNADAVVVHIGCGLDTRFERVDNGLVEWFDLDLPDVIMLREKLLGGLNKRCHMIPSSVFDSDWMKEVDRYGTHPTLFIAEGVFQYFTEAQVKSLFIGLGRQYPNAELVCDAHSPLMVKLDNFQLAAGKIKARLQWSLKKGRDVELWGGGIHLLDEYHYFEGDDPGLKTFWWIRLFPPLMKATGIYHYRLGSYE